MKDYEKLAKIEELCTQMPELPHDYPDEEAVKRDELINEIYNLSL